MKFRIKFADQIVGVFVLLSISVLVLILVLMGINQQWFQKNYYFNSRFPSGVGLSVGMPVKLKGFQIGSLRKIKLNENNMVDVEFYIYEDYYNKVQPNTLIQHKVNPLKFGTELVLHPGKTLENPSPVPENSFILAYDSDKGQEIRKNELIDLIAEDDAVTAIISQIEPILRNVNRTLIDVNHLIEGKSQGHIGLTIKNIEVITRAVSENINQNLEDIGLFITNISEVSNDFEKMGPVPALMGDEFDNLLKGLNSTMQELSKFSEFLNSASPQLIGLIEQGNAALGEGKAVLEGLKNNPILRGGISPEKAQPDTFQSIRDEDF